jgi:hypothetical protein
MTYKKHRDDLEKLMYGYILYIDESQDPDDISKIEYEIRRLKNEIQCLNDLTESQLHEQRKTITLTIESCMKYFK